MAHTRIETLAIAALLLLLCACGQGYAPPCAQTSGLQLTYAFAQTNGESETPRPAAKTIAKRIEQRAQDAGLSDICVFTPGREGPITLSLGATVDRDQALNTLGLGPSAAIAFHLVADEDDLAATDSGFTTLPTTDSFEPSLTIFADPALTGEHIERAELTVDAYPDSRRPTVSIEFDREGSRIFADLTRHHVGKRFAIVIDEVVVSAPVIRSPITQGSALIEGDFTSQEAQSLAQRLKGPISHYPLLLESETTFAASAPEG